MRKQIFALLLCVLVVANMSGIACASSETQASVPVTLTVLNTVQKISVTVPAALPVSVIDGEVVVASNAAIVNNADQGSVQVTAVTVLSGSFGIGDFNNFAGDSDTIALSLNGCVTTGEGPVSINGIAFPAIVPGGSLPIAYSAKVKASATMQSETVATVIFTISKAS